MARCDFESFAEIAESTPEDDRGGLDEGHQQSFSWFEEQGDRHNPDLDGEDPQQVIQRRKTLAKAQKGIFVCNHCGNEFVRRGKKASELRRAIRANQKRLKFCSQECSSAFQRLHGFQPDGVARRLMKRLSENGFKCELTGVRLTLETFAIDHVVPLSKGGTNDFENLQIVHATVNKMKGTLSQDEFITWCKRIAAAASYGMGTTL
jgi:hypothetical protein